MELTIQADGLTDIQLKYITAFAQSSNFSKTEKETGLFRNNHYRYMSNNETYRKAFYKAKEQFLNHNNTEIDLLHISMLKQTSDELSERLESGQISEKGLLELHKTLLNSRDRNREKKYEIAKKLLKKVEQVNK